MGANVSAARPQGFTVAASFPIDLEPQLLALLSECRRLLNSNAVGNERCPHDQLNQVAKES